MSLSDVRVVAAPLGGPSLTTRALNGSIEPGWYADVPRGGAAWTTHCRAVARASGDWIDALRPAFGDGGRLLDRVRAGGVVVATGQQPGLFGGPWYTWFKALSALETANAIERATGIPAVPVFWAATDDADFAEAASTVVAGASGPERLTLTAAPPDGVPMAHALLHAETGELYARLGEAAGSSADPRPLRAAEAFHDGVTVGAAFVAMLRQMLEPLGIPVLDAGHPSVGNAVRAPMERALSRADAVHKALVHRRDALRDAGFEPPVEVDRALSLVFAWEPGADGLPRKRRLAVDETGQRPASVRLSPNVLLRPIAERTILPAVAYVAGPGEIAYFSMVSAAADALDVPVPVVVPRWSGQIVPREIADILDRLGIAADELRDPHAAEARLARAALPANATGALASLRAAVDRDVRPFAGLLTPEALEGARTQLQHRLDRIERRLLAAVKHRGADTQRLVGEARGVLFPFGKAQERVLNAVPMWCRFGDSLIAEVRAACAAHAQELVNGKAGA